jgi:uncharacterized protein
MTPLGKLIRTSPIHARFVPFAVLVGLIFFQESFGAGAGRYWMYLVRMAISGWCIWEMRSMVPEIRWAFSWEAAVAGILVCAMWIGIDPYYPKIEFLFKASEPWNPFKQFGNGTAMAWFFVAVRTLGSTFVVPPIEEAFYRSFLYRYFVRLDFENMPFNQLHWLSLMVTSMLFGLEHYQWLSGFLCGLVFQALVLRKNRLGDAITAHALTNFLLSVWIVWRNDWKFW